MDSERNCDTCRHGLGGGCCRINLEAECGKGEHEAWEPKEEDMDWAGVEKYLEMLIELYKLIKCTDLYFYRGVLMPLKERLDGGERTMELYREIMSYE